MPKLSFSQSLFSSDVVDNKKISKFICGLQFAPFVLDASGLARCAPGYLKHALSVSSSTAIPYILVLLHDPTNFIPVFDAYGAVVWSCLCSFAHLASTRQVLPVPSPRSRQ